MSGGSSDASPHPLLPRLTPIFEELATPAKCEEGAYKLNRLIEDEGDILFHRDNAQNQHSKFLQSWLLDRLGAMCAKPDTRPGGVLAIAALMDVEFCDMTLRVETFWNLLTKAVLDSAPSGKGGLATLQNLQPQQTAARVWGMLVASGYSFLTDKVSRHVEQCMEWLVVENLYDRKYVSCLFLQELTRKQPGAILYKLDNIFREIWRALRDPNDTTRVCAAATLKQAIDVAVSSSGVGGCSKWVDPLMLTVIKSLTLRQKEGQHGGILAFNALLESCVDAQATTPVEVNAAVLRDAWKICVQWLEKPASAPELRQEVLRTVPLLAVYSRDLFVEDLNLFVAAAATAFRATTGPDERELMFLAVGRLSTVLKDKIPAFFDRMFPHIEGNLVKKPKGRDRCQAAATCFAMIAQSDPNTARPFVTTLLRGPLFAGPPTVGLAKDVAQLCTAFPEYRSECLDKMVIAVREQLDLVKYRPVLAPGDEQGTQALLDALNALSTLDFTGFSVVTFLADHVVKYLVDPHPDVRRTAAALCSRLVLTGCFAPGSQCCKDANGVVVHVGHSHIRLIVQVVKALLSVAVADSKTEIRLSALNLLTDEFDHILSLQDCIRAIFPALNDKQANRIAAIRLLGRLAKRNPACVYPMLRKVMIQCVTEIQYFHHVRKQEQATTVLSVIVEAAPAMIRPYVPSLLANTVDRLKDPNAQSSVMLLTALLACVGQLVKHIDDANIPLVRAVRSVVISHVLDGTSLEKKQEAIRSLGEIVRATRDVHIYDENPELLHVLLSSLHGGFKEAWPMRQDVLRLMGIIGAVDPVKVKSLNRTVTERTSGDAAALLNRARGEDSTALTVVSGVLEVLQLPSTQDEVCACATQAIVNIFLSREMQLSSTMANYAKVIGSILRHIQIQPKIRDKLFGHLTALVFVAKHHIRVHLNEIFETIKQFLRSDEVDVLTQILGLLSELRRSLNEEFKPYLPAVLPLLVRAVQQDTIRCAERIFDCLTSFGKVLNGHLHIVLPCVADVASSASLPVACRIAAVLCMMQFAKHLTSIADHAARCVHSLCRILSETPKITTTKDKEERESLLVECWTALCAIAQNLGPAFHKFAVTVVPIVSQRFGETHFRSVQFKRIVEESVNSGIRQVFPEVPRMDEQLKAPELRDILAASSSDRFATIKAILAPTRTGEDEWKQWLRTFSIEVLRASPCPSHLYALPLAQIHEPFARRLFHPAFAACFAKMDESTKQQVVAMLTTILSNSRLPSEVLQELLNLSEYMERNEMPQQALTSSNGVRTKAPGLFDISILTGRSETCNLHAKALHYLEVQFVELTREYERSTMRGRPTKLTPEAWKELFATCEKSIYLCNLLGQRDSANGILTFVERNYSQLTGDQSDKGFNVVDAEMCEKLQWWSQSYKAYHDRYRTTNAVGPLIGMMTALDAQGNFTAILDLWRQHVKRTTKDAPLIAPFGARAAWLLQSWDDMQLATEQMRSDGYTGTTSLFYQAVLATHKSKFREASLLVDKCRRNLDGELSALVAESYDRAYRLFVGIQQLSELDEIATALREPDTIKTLQQLWESRLLNMAQEPTEWQGTLANHTLVLKQNQELGMWIKFVDLCHAHGRDRMSSEVLTRLLGGKNVVEAVRSPDSTVKPLVALAAFSHLYATGRQGLALENLEYYVEKMGPVDTSTDFALCLTRLSEWIAAAPASNFPFARGAVQEALVHLRRATELERSNGHVWHVWARMHHDIVNKLGARGDPQFDEHVTAAIEGYLHSIRLNEELQDVLGFLSIWFSHGGSDRQLASIHQVNVNVWLRVMPQLIARISTPNKALADSVLNLLIAIARTHPQALLYTLNSGSAHAGDESSRRNKILAKIVEMHADGQQLVNDASLVCRELVRCAVLWPEMWYDALDRLCAQYSVDGNLQAAYDGILPLLRMMDSPSTVVEKEFALEFGDHLRAAASKMCDTLSRQFPAEKERDKEVAEVWEQFRDVCERMDKQIQGMSNLVLQLVSPQLLHMGKNLLLAVPGQYNPTGPFPRISSFVPTLRVMQSKQHPRRISLIGSDGLTYKYLLKGHEDLRLDERVMQLLGLVNNSLEAHSSTKRRDFVVQVYSVTPLGDNAGLVGWVDNCNTLHAIIKDHREVTKTIGQELAYMRSVSEDPTRLTLIARVESFEWALENTEGNDLARSLWIHAPSAEVWLDRRTTYVRTLATMSMVGHILGLGDRHPSNLMIHAFSGRVVHIDFGDCFEVAMHRKVFPEKVPFRLTRMLVKAMEIGGIEGLFRHGCIAVMSMLRQERSSLLAMLEAFLHDPLVDWWRAEACENPPGGAPGTNVAETADFVGSIKSVVDRGQRRLPAHPTVLPSHAQSRKAQKVLDRINEKLSGTEFGSDDQYAPKEPVTIDEQVARLVEQATSNENLCQHFQGWCAFW